MALTRLNVNTALSATLPVSKGGTGVTTAADLANTGNMVKISSATASNDSSISFTSGIDSTYSIYKFEFLNIHPVTDDVDFGFLLSNDSGSNYNLEKTGAGFQLQGNEAGDSFTLGHISNFNSAEVTGRTPLSHSTGNNTDEQFSGHLFLYNPSNTTFVKSYMSFIQSYHALNIAQLHVVQGYCNRQTAINAIKFEFSSGNIETGSITMYGVKT